ncbi:MAG: LysR family transcriptional regulator [Pyrinomonadaceae bacterium]|nr:LysR family transcriptional regulator [Pyrinomonadaceae bacterium]
MHDLNDLHYFVQVVDHRGFAPAGRVLGQPKSKLSRRIALLEDRLGVRLIQRSTRHFSVTEIGQNYYAHCKAMLVEADAAQAAVEQTRSEPSGIVRLSCPVALLHARVTVMLAGFMIDYPRVVVHLDATNRRVDLIAEGIDVAMRVRPLPIEASDLMLKILAPSGQALVASPNLVERAAAVRVPAELNSLPSLDLGPPREEHTWKLEGPDGAQAIIHHRPRLVSDDMITLRSSAVAGVGVVQLPLLMVSEEIQNGQLIYLLPSWAPKRQVVHAVYPSRRGLLPSVRALLDYLGARFSELRED